MLNKLSGVFLQQMLCPEYFYNNYLPFCTFPQETSHYLTTELSLILGCIGGQQWSSGLPKYIALDYLSNLYFYVCHAVLNCTNKLTSQTEKPSITYLTQHLQCFICASCRETSWNISLPVLRCLVWTLTWLDAVKMKA